MSEFFNVPLIASSYGGVDLGLKSHMKEAWDRTHDPWAQTHQYPDLLLSVSVNYHVAGDAYVTSESIFCKTPPKLN